MINYRRYSKPIIVTAIIILMLFFLHFIRVLRPIENLLISMTKPFLEITYSASNKIGQGYLNFKDKTTLEAENQELRKTLLQLTQEKSICQEHQEENVFLREQLNFVRSKNFDYEIAEVVAKNYDDVQNTLIINKGTEQGLEIGQPVLATDGILIGKILKVNKNNAFVLLINDDISNVAAKIQNQDKTMGVVQGEYGLGMKMLLISQTEIINEGDIVVTSGLENNVPAGLIIGYVNSVVAEPEDLFKEASIKSLVDFSKITLVNIIKNKNVD